MLQQFRQYIEDNALLNTHERVIVALSGGPDSVALLDLLLRSGYVCIAAHCNFRLRGEEADNDERFVKDLCRRLQIQLYVKHFDTLAYARQNHISVEMAARELRYAWFEDLCKDLNCNSVAVAHHQNDQAETLLLNLKRGTGLRGLRGMMPRNGHIIRPLLFCTRQNIIDYLTLRHWEYVQDSTNTDRRFQRNRIRQEIQDYSQAQINHIAETAALMGEYTKIVDHYTEQIRQRITDGNRIDIQQLLSLPAPKTTLYELIKDYGFTQIDDIFRSLTSHAGKRFFSDRYILLRDRQYLCIYPKDYTLPEDLSFSVKEIEGSIAGITFPEADKRRIIVDGKVLNQPLSIRQWQSGDRFMPLGMRRMKNISDFLTDLHLPLTEKNKVQVLCSGKDIVWVIGYRIDNRYKLLPSSTHIIEITLT